MLLEELVQAPRPVQGRGGRDGFGLPKVGRDLRAERADRHGYAGSHAHLHLHGDARARTVLVDRANAGDEVWSVTVVRTEVLAGVRRGEEETTRALLASLKWQSVTVDIADRAGELARRFLRSYPGVAFLPD